MCSALMYRSSALASRNMQCKVAGVKGISDAVRGAINDWITQPLKDILYAEYQKSGGKMSKVSFGNYVDYAEQWKRYSRGNDPNGDGFFRKYYCKAFDKGVVDLHVLTNYDDTKIKYVTFVVRGKLVYGGACNVPSTLWSQYGYNPTLKNVVSPTTTAAFVPFSPAQLAKLSTQLEYGSISMIDRMLEERV